MGKYNSGEHVYNYVAKMFRGFERPIPFNSHQFREICNFVYTKNKLLRSDFERLNITEVILRELDDVFTYRLRVLLIDESENWEIEEFVKTYIKEINNFTRHYIGGEKENPNTNFWEEYFTFENLFVDIDGNTFTAKFGQKYSNDFIEDFNKYRLAKGLYFLYDITNEIELVYIGKSKRLFERMRSSSTVRSSELYRYTLIDSESDMHVYEMYYISKYKPRYNVEGVSDDELTIELPELEFSELKELYEVEDNGKENN